MNYWWLAVNPKEWRFFDMEVGEVEDFDAKTTGGKLKAHFANARAGDLVIGYETSPHQKITALCEIAKELDGQALYVRKTENVLNPVDYHDIAGVAELQNMAFIKNHMGTLFPLTEEEYNFLIEKIREQAPLPLFVQGEPYDEKSFLADVYMQKADYKRLRLLLENKKNVILQGPPGTGKTHAAKRLAYSMMGSTDDSRIEFVQFHQSYSYEDFIMGYKPEKDRFELKEGIFFRFCKKAKNRLNDDHFFIIDEINRGNISKILGEVLMGIENSHRGDKINMVYDGYIFSVPKNLYIIGMMNTADRSLAQIDYALRRRFSFFPLSPAFENENFKAYQKSLDSAKLDRLINTVKELNEAIDKDNSLGEGCRIGHSYFCEQQSCSDEWLKNVVEFDLIPILAEYWFDEKTKVQDWAKKLRESIK